MGERSEQTRHQAAVAVPATGSPRPRPQAPQPEALPKLMEPADLYRIPLWALTKPLYAVAPGSLLLRLATLKGTIESFSSPLRQEARDALERHLAETTDEDPAAILKRHFQYRSRARFARLWPQIRDFTGSEKIAVEGLHHLDEALAHGRGAVLVSAHFGYARLIKPILRSRGRDVLVVGNLRPGMPDFRPELFGLPAFTRVGSFVHTRVLRLPRWSRFDPRFRETTGVDLPTGINVRPHVAALEANKTLVILIDGRHAQSLKRVSILGMDVYLAPGAMSLARATGAPVLPAFVTDDLQSRDATSLRLEIHPPLSLQVTGDADDDLDVNLRGFAAVYEDEVRARPHSWHWHAMRDGVLDPGLAER